MTTRRQLERVIVHQAIYESAAFDHAEFLQRKLDEQSRRRIEIAKERSTLLAENATLRTEIDLLWETVHGLAADRRIWRDRLRKAIRKLHLSRFGRKHATR